MKQIKHIQIAIILLNCKNPHKWTTQLTLFPSASRESSAWLATSDRKWSKHWRVSLLQAGSRQMSNCMTVCWSTLSRAAQTPQRRWVESRRIKCWFIKGILHPEKWKFTHPQAIQDVSSSDLEKCSIASLSQQWMLCTEWVPSEWESKQLIKTSQ